VSDAAIEGLLRRLAPQVLGAVVRRYGNFDTAEDAVQEALLAAAVQWPVDGVPDAPLGWLITVASRRLTDLLRAAQARQRREETVFRLSHAVPPPSQPPTDDSLILLFMCCHPALKLDGQVALTLRAVGGLTTAEVARAFLVPEATMTRRISRAKQRVKASGIPFSLPPPAERAGRLAAVLHVLYLIFNEGYAATAGPALHRADLSGEAIRLTRLVHRLLPEDSEVAGLLALMLLTDARRPARATADGALVPMAEQDRGLWDAGLIAEGVALITAALPKGGTGPYQIQAAIAAVHDESPSAEATDWPQIVALYELLMRRSANPIVALNHAVAVTMARGAPAGLALLDGLTSLEADHRLHAVRAHLLEMSGDAAGARAAYLIAAGLTSSLPQQRYLNARAARLPLPE
jgi:RNA polymerase sigma factor (sigma-70 family)